MRSFLMALLSLSVGSLGSAGISGCKAAPTVEGVAHASTIEGDEPGGGGNEPGNEGDDTVLPAAGVAPGNGTAHALLYEIDRQLSRMRSTSYTHQTQIDERSGTYNFDCSAFAGYSLQNAAPRAWDELRAATGVRTGRPLARHFQGFFASLPQGSGRGEWFRVSRVQDLVPGDVVAWLRPPDVVSKNTGHVVVVHGPVTPWNGRPGAFLVPVADSTSMLHGVSDSRHAAGATGLGTGTLILEGDAYGAPVAYRWSLGSRAVDHACTIAMGRLARR
jgi:hypothetical protein